MSKPEAEAGTIGLRLPADLMGQVDEFIRKEGPLLNLELDRSKAIRILVRRGLAASGRQGKK